jgi:hypothetical protein
MCPSHKQAFVTRFFGALRNAYPRTYSRWVTKAALLPVIAEDSTIKTASNYAGVKRQIKLSSGTERRNWRKSGLILERASEAGLSCVT